MQLLKYLQAQGIGSRKQCLWLIENDCVALNGSTHNRPKENIEPADIRTLEIDGEPQTVQIVRQGETTKLGYFFGLV